nr:hypothetical protein GCM10020092_038700 [Actinoplanes digitatis]
MMAAAGPCLAVGSAKPRAVAAVCAYTLVLAVWISMVTGGLPTFGETRLLVLITCVFVLCVVLARG